MVVAQCVTIVIGHAAALQAIVDLYLVIFVMLCCLNLGFQDQCGRSSVQQAPEPTSDKLAEPLSE